MLRHSRNPDEARPLRIGINALFLIPGQIGGAEIFVRRLLQAMATIDSHNRYVVFRNRETGPDLVPAAPNVEDRPLPIAAASRPARIAYEQTLFLGNLANARLDALLNLGFTAPLLAPLPMATIVYDLQYVHHPECFRPLDLAVWRTLVPLSARRSRRLISMSRDGREDLERAFPWSARKIDVVPHGIDDALVAVGEDRARGDGPEPLLLCLSALRAHKNLENLLIAFARFRARNPTYRLAISGPRDAMASRLEALRDELGLRDAVDFLGWIEREDVLALFRRAAALVFPSRFEGFGIPVLEALAARLPVACSDIAPLREIAGDAACYFDPGDVDAMAGAFERVTGDAALRSRLASDGLRSAGRYTWDASARTLVGALVAMATNTHTAEMRVRA